MDMPRHVVAVHPSPQVVEALTVALSRKGFVVHPAATFGDATALLTTLDVAVAAVIAHAEMPTEPKPGTLLKVARVLHPEAALVVLSARCRHDIGPLPRNAVLLREPFDRCDLLAAIEAASKSAPA